MTLRFLKLITSLLLLGFAYLQLNDSDGIIWSGVYLFPILCLFRRKPSLHGNIIISLIYFYYAFLLWPSEYYGIGTMTNQPEVEQARESLGVLIAGILLCVTSIIDNRNPQ